MPSTTPAAALVALVAHGAGGGAERVGRFASHLLTCDTTFLALQPAVLGCRAGHDLDEVGEALVDEHFVVIAGVGETGEAGGAVAGRGGAAGISRRG